MSEEDQNNSNASDTAKEVESVSEEESETPVKESDSPKKNGKSPVKDTKEDSENEDSENSDSSDDEEELPPGLLERPLEIEGKREKKKVERLTGSNLVGTPKEKERVKIVDGSGIKLGDIPHVEEQIGKTKAADLKPLHRVLFLRLAELMQIKKNIRAFSGEPNGKESKEHVRRMASLNKMQVSQLKQFCLTLCLERGGAKQDIIDRLEEFLLKPELKKPAIGSIKRKRSKSKTPKGKKAKSKKPKESAKKKKKSKKEESEDEDDESEDETPKKKKKAKKVESDDEEEDSEDEEPPKKKKKKVEAKSPSPKKKVTPKKKDKKKPTPKKKATPKQNGKKKTPTKKAAEMSDLSSDDSDSDDEPLIKKKKGGPPDNDELEDLVKKILKGADLETVTMKTVVKQVYAKYPTFDLSDRKDFIKDTVRECIS